MAIRCQPKAAVRIEELVNYFHYDYPQPDNETPFSAAMEVATCPWAPEHRLLRVGLHGRDLARNARPCEQPRVSDRCLGFDAAGEQAAAAQAQPCN
jgi:hypothetical protein